MTYLKPLKRFPDLLGPNKFLFFLILFISLIVSLLSGVGDPVFLKLLVDSLTQKKAIFFIIFSLTLIFLSIFVRFSSFFANLYAQKLKNKICEYLSLKLLENYYKIPYSKIINQDEGYFISRIYDEPAQISEIIDLIINLFRIFLTFSGSIVVCLFLSWKITILLSIIVPFLLYLSSKFGSKISGTTVQESEKEAKLREILGRVTESFKNVNIFGLYKVINKKVSESLKDYLNLVYFRVKLSSLFQTASGIFLSFAEIIVLIGAGVEVLNNRMSIGGLFAFMSGYWRVINSFKELIELTPSLSKLNGYITRLEEFETFSKVKREFPSYNHIELKNIDFGFNNNKIFRKFNLSLKKGEKVLIAGPNGSGKTTLAHIICGFLEINSGEARLPELDRISALLPSSGFVPGSLMDNINYENLCKEKRALFLSLANKLDIYDKIENDPMLLSEGERRKFQVIMTLLKEADFYIFDEPLTNIDSNSKDIIMDIIFTLTKNKTLIVIMHGEEKFKNKFDKEVKLCIK